MGLILCIVSNETDPKFGSQNLHSIENDFCIKSTRIRFEATVYIWELFENELKPKNMKCFAVLMLVTYFIAIISAKNIAENELARGGESAAAPKQSIQSLFKTLTQLVQGVLDDDKFVLNLLHLTPPLDLTDNQITDLKTLLKSLNTINRDLKAEIK